MDGFGQARFLTTRWSVVLSCSDSATDEDKSQAALAELCKIYWRPVFAFICRQGHSVPDAQDLTQEFFAKVLKGRLLQSADRNRGRFRSLLLTALQRFLHDQVDKHQARKRGGDVRFVSWDDWMTEAPSHPHLAARSTYVSAGGITQPGVAPRFSRTPGSAGPVELPGAHSRSVLEQWGVPDPESLLAGGVVHGR